MRRTWATLVLLLVVTFVGLGLPASVQAEGVDDGLVAEWHFDEGSGSVLVDSSGNGNDGVIYGATWVEGTYGKALSFDGADDYVGVPDSPLWNFGTGDFTVSFWFKKLDADRGHTLSFGSMGHGNNLNFDFDDKDSGGKGVWVYWMGGGIPRVWTTTTYHDSNWHHLSFIRMGNVFKLYIDDNYIDQTTDSSNIQIIGNLCIGRNNYNGGQNYFNGIIDEVRIYNRALTAEEIKQHYEGKQTALSLTKSASPHSIKQGQTTTVTLTVKNTGTTEIADIEIADTLPTDLFLVSGETSKRYDPLRPKDSREFQYVLQPSDAGTFNLDPATATYADEEGNYHTAESGTVAIEVIPSTGTTPAPIIPAHSTTTALSITKSPSLNSIRQFGETVITLSIKNAGTTDVTDIEITDGVHPSFDLVSGDFPNPKRYDLIRPGETRDLQYTIRALESGTFTLDHATVTYADADGNIQEADSEPYSIRVVPSTSGSAAGASQHPASISTASIHLHGEKTDVVMGEDILLKLSAVNKITKPTMTLQVILIPPSGMSVTSADFVESGAGLYTSTYVIEPGIGRDIEVGIRSNQVGDFVVNGEVIYYFGDDKENAEEHILSLPITVRASPDSQQNTLRPPLHQKMEREFPDLRRCSRWRGCCL